MTVLQSLRQQSVRDVTGTALDYNGDWSALFDDAGIAAGPWNGRLLAWINDYLGTSYTSLPAAKRTFAVDQGFDSWNSMGTFDAAGEEQIAPILSSATDTSAGPTTADLSVTTDEANGTLYAVITTSSTPPSAAQVKAGQDHASAAAAYAANQAIDSTGAKSFSATGLTQTTAYHSYFMHEDAVGNQSAVLGADGFTTHTAASFSHLTSDPSSADSATYTSTSSPVAEGYMLVRGVYVAAAERTKTITIDAVNCTVIAETKYQPGGAGTAENCVFIAISDTAIPAAATGLCTLTLSSTGVRGGVALDLLSNVDPAVIDTITNEVAGTPYDILDKSIDVRAGGVLFAICHQSRQTATATRRWTGAAATTATTETVTIGVDVDTATGLAAWQGALSAGEQFDEIVETTVASNTLLCAISLGPAPPPSFGSEELAIFAAATPTPNTAEKQRIADLVTALDAESTWDAIDVLQVYDTYSQGAAHINWKNPGTRDATRVTAIDFVSSMPDSLPFERGYNVRGPSSYINTGFNPSLHGSAYTQNAASFSIWSGRQRTSGVNIAGIVSAVAMLPRSATNNVSYRINQSTASTISGGLITDGRGWFTAKRTGASATKFRRNGVDIGTGSVTSAALANDTIKLGLVGTLYDEALFKAFCVGNLTDAQDLILYNALNAYFTARDEIDFTFTGTNTVESVAVGAATGTSVGTFSSAYDTISSIELLDDWDDTFALDGSTLEVGTVAPDFMGRIVNDDPDLFYGVPYYPIPVRVTFANGDICEKVVRVRPAPAVIAPTGDQTANVTSISAVAGGVGSALNNALISATDNRTITITTDAIGTFTKADSAVTTFASENITITGHRRAILYKDSTLVINPGTVNVIFKDLCFRVGNDAGGDLTSRDVLRIAGGRNMVFENCSFSWSCDELVGSSFVSGSSRPRNVLFKRCLFAEPLWNAGHGEGVHPYGVLIQDHCNDVVFIKCVWLGCHQRSPEFERVHMGLLQNCVIAFGVNGGTGLRKGGLSAYSVPNGQGSTIVVRNNLYQPAMDIAFSSTEAALRAVAITADNVGSGSEFYVAGNHFFDVATRDFTSDPIDFSSHLSYVATLPFVPADYSLMPTSTAVEREALFDDVLNYVGCRTRTAGALNSGDLALSEIDHRIITAYRLDNFTMVDDPTDVGGFVTGVPA